MEELLGWEALPKIRAKFILTEKPYNLLVIIQWTWTKLMNAGERGLHNDVAGVGGET